MVSGIRPSLIGAALACMALGGRATLALDLGRPVLREPEPEALPPAEQPAKPAPEPRQLSPFDRDALSAAEAKRARRNARRTQGGAA